MTHKEVLTAVGVVALMIGIGIAGLTLPRMPWEAPSTYCGRVHPIDSTKQHTCVEEYTAPPQAVVDWVESKMAGASAGEINCVAKKMDDTFTDEQLARLVNNGDGIGNELTLAEQQAFVREALTCEGK